MSQLKSFTKISDRMFLKSNSLASPPPSEPTTPKSQTFSFKLVDLLSENRIPGLLAGLAALALASAGLFNFGYVFAWDVSAVVLFTPGDYVSLAIPISIILGVLLITLSSTASKFSAVTASFVIFFFLTMSLGAAMLFAIVMFIYFESIRLTYDTSLKESKEKQNRWTRLKYRFAPSILLLLCILFMLFSVMTFFNIAPSNTALSIVLVLIYAHSAYMMSYALTKKRSILNNFALVNVQVVLIAMPLAGYSFFINQWETALHTTESNCMSSEGETVMHSSVCVLRPIERGVIFVNSDDETIAYEDIYQRRIQYKAPASIPETWIDAIGLPGEIKNGAAIFDLSDWFSSRKSYVEYRMSDESGNKDN